MSDEFDDFRPIPEPTRRYLFSFHVRLTNPVWRFERRRLLVEQERIHREHEDLKARILSGESPFIPWAVGS